MQRLLAVAICLLAWSACAAIEPAEGRWEGIAQIPDYPCHVTIDLGRDASGNWNGSIIIPELSIKGVALTDIAQRDATISFAIKDILAAAPTAPARFEAQLGANALMTGTFTQAGNSAPFTLKRTGTAQVDLPPHSTAVAKELEGKWAGDYELTGYPRHVTITLANHDGAPATAEFVIVGKKVNNLPVDLVTQDGDFLRIESHAIGISFEGRVNRERNEIAGICAQGPFEPALVVHRDNGKLP
jgi:hypothetical protein